MKRPVCIKSQEKLDSRAAEKHQNFQTRGERSPGGSWCQPQSLTLSKAVFDIKFSLCFGKEHFLSFMFGQEASLLALGEWKHMAVERSLK